MFLTTKDFSIRNGELFKPKDRGFSFVFFMTNGYGYKDMFFMRELESAFEYAKNTLKGCKFYYVNIDQDIIKMSERTHTPIVKTNPTFLMFGNGKYLDRYFPDTKNNKNKMVNFVLETTKRWIDKLFTSTQTFDADTVPIPSYSIGIPGNYADHHNSAIYSRY